MTYSTCESIIFPVIVARLASEPQKSNSPEMDHSNFIIIKACNNDVIDNDDEIEKRILAN